jgi:hypothetical protein
MLAILGAVILWAGLPAWALIQNGQVTLGILWGVIVGIVVGLSLIKESREIEK